MLWAECQPGDTGGNLWAEQEGDGDEGAEVGDHGQGANGEEGGLVVVVIIKQMKVFVRIGQQLVLHSDTSKLVLRTKSVRQSLTRLIKFLLDLSDIFQSIYLIYDHNSIIKYILI